MKRIFTLLMVGLTAFFVSCDSGDSDTGGSEWFSTPESTVVGTTVELRCATKFGPGVLTGSNAGFLYAVVSDEGMGAVETVPAGSVDGSTLSATLSGLQEETFYVVYAYADLGAGQMQSVGISVLFGRNGFTPPIRVGFRRCCLCVWHKKRGLVDRAPCMWHKRFALGGIICGAPIGE